MLAVRQLVPFFLAFHRPTACYRCWLLVIAKRGTSLGGHIRVRSQTSPGGPLCPPKSCRQRNKAPPTWQGLLDIFDGFGWE